MTAEVLSVPDISCEHCKTSIEGAVGGLDGVRSVTVAIEPKTVAVDFDETATDLTEITAAIEAVGYEIDEP